MELKVAEDKSTPKREFQIARARNQKAVRSNLLEAIAQVNGGGVVSRTDEDGMVRMKIVVRKQDLKQMLEVIRGGKSSPGQPSEQHLNFMRRRHVWRASQVKGSCRGSWRPALLSIPEEL